MTDLEWSIEQTVKHRRGLSKELSSVLGIGQTVLLNKVDSNCDGKHLSVMEGHRIMKHTGDIRILEEQARDLGYRLEKNETEATELMDSVLSLMSENGELSGLVQSSMADGLIDDKEKRQILSKARQLHRAVERFESSIEAE